MNPVIKVNNAVKKFGRKLALDGVSLEVPSGVVFALLGENGAGKTTLIRSMLGYYKLNSGSIEVLGMDPSRRALELRRKVGYVSDQPGMYEWMTVSQVGWYASGFYPEGFADRYVRIANGFGLPADTKVRNLSKGMKAKVALAAALAMDPELLVLDEPTSGLDPLVRRSFLESMVDRAASGKTVLLSSHQVQEVERVADWVAIVNGGKMQIVSPLETLKNEVSIVTATQRDSLIPLPDMSAVTCYDVRQSGRQWRMVVRGWSEAIEQQWRADANISEIKVVRPSLEDLYIAFTAGDLSSRKAAEAITGVSGVSVA